MNTHNEGLLRLALVIASMIPGMFIGAFPTYRIMQEKLDKGNMEINEVREYAKHRRIMYVNNYERLQTEISKNDFLNRCISEKDAEILRLKQEIDRLSSEGK